MNFTEYPRDGVPINNSSTLFLQQLGRGLRKSPGKTVCTVLDFVGQHRAEYRFENRLGALLGLGRRQLIEQVEQDFPFLPAGCHMELERKAKDIVLQGLRASVPSRWTAKVTELRRLADGAASYGLADYLWETGLELDELYDGNRCWSELLADAGLPVAVSGPEELNLRRAIGRLLHVDDRPRLDAYTALLSSKEPPKVAALDQRQARYLRMLVASLVDKSLTMEASLDAGCHLIWQHPQVRAELLELFALLGSRVTHLPIPLATHPRAPLQIHARYTRLELLAALGVGKGAKIANWVTGVRYEKESRADVFAFTLDKTSGQFSPTTRYRDYAISRELIHWESQAITRASSETGLRYQQHAQRGSHVMMFARLRADERAFFFLGPATYVKHEGELPMAITWRLAVPLPGDLFSVFAAAVA